MKADIREKKVRTGKSSAQFDTSDVQLDTFLSEDFTNHVHLLQHRRTDRTPEISTHVSVGETHPPTQSPSTHTSSKYKEKRRVYLKRKTRQIREKNFNFLRQSPPPPTEAFIYFVWTPHFSHAVDVPCTPPNPLLHNSHTLNLFCRPRHRQQGVTWDECKEQP